METDQLGRLQDILHSARLIASYVRNRSETEFLVDTEKQDAVIRRIEIIGEAAANPEDSRRARLPESNLGSKPFTSLRAGRSREQL